MKQTMIGTWKMAFDGIRRGAAVLREQSVKEAIRTAIQDVEQREEFVSVGKGGLPNIDGHVQLDAAYMDGKTLNFGGVIEMENVASAIEVAASLCGKHCNCLLAGKGAEGYAQEEGFTFANNLTEASKQRWKQAKKDADLKAYDGHDTVCVLAAKDDEMAAGVSTSGLFLKHAGRVGDSPVIGSGFYSDAMAGSAAATGLGEDIMRGCLSVRVVDLMRAGIAVQDALIQVLDTHMARMKQAGNDCDAISMIAMDTKGNCAAVTNLKEFPYVVAQDGEVTLMVAAYENGVHRCFPADEAWLKQYSGD